ncbi:hypothetical protein [uncultured Tenacibaculum sp.]|uniref:hypothetical protein n=1 Tax=uncultured Tenacibaculum sp. TaxID=174713 RepID=UPI00260C2A53|nr:hypothetical protein [uncultured Tenacibaculum sp.]
MKKIFLIILLIVVSISCKDKKKSKIDETDKAEIKTQVKPEVSVDKNIVFHRNDTIIKFYNIENSYGVFKWSVDGKFENQGKDTLSFDETKINKIRKIGDSFIYTDGCGSACDYILISKFISEDKGTTFLYPLLVDEKKELIIYKGDKENVLLSIYDLKTGEIKEVIEDFDKTIRPPKNVVEQVSINEKGNLVIEWVKPNSIKTKKEIVL